MALGIKDAGLRAPGLYFSVMLPQGERKKIPAALHAHPIQI